MNNIKLMRYITIVIVTIPLQLMSMNLTITQKLDAQTLLCDDHKSDDTSKIDLLYDEPQPIAIVPRDNEGKIIKNMVVKTTKPLIKPTKTLSQQELNEWNLAKTLFASPEYALVKSILYTQEATKTDADVLERLKKATALSATNSTLIRQLELKDNQLNGLMQKFKKRVAVKPVKSKKNAEEQEEEYYCRWLQASAETFKAQTNQSFVAIPNAQLSPFELTEKRKALLANNLIDLAQQRSTIAKKNYISRLRLDALGMVFAST